MTRGRWLFAGLSLALLVVLALRPARIAGDGYEYLVTLEAWRGHAGPDIRAEDEASAVRLLGPRAPAARVRERALVEGRDGRRYTLHFWLYPLLCLPARVLLEALGLDPLAAMPLSNGLLFAAALGAVLFASRLEPARRAWLAALAAVSPVLGYLAWPHPEVFTWCAVLLFAAAWLEGAHARAVLLASLGATHNPPLLLAAGCALLLAVHERGARRSAAAFLALLPAALPFAFSLRAFGVPSPLVASGGADPALIAPGRAASLLLDLNLGVLAHAPGVLILGLAGLAVILGRRDARLALLALLLLGMALIASSTPNLNHGAAGLSRYAVWLLPLLAALGLPGRAGGRAWAALAGLALLLDAVLVLRRDGREDYLELSQLARFVLDRSPALYSPPPEIFAERVLHWDGVGPHSYPVLHARPDGVVRKLLLDPDACARLRLRVIAPESFLAAAERRCAGARGPFYLTPEEGSVRRLFSAPPLAEADVAGLRMKVFKMRTEPATGALHILLDLHNRGPATLYGADAQHPGPVDLGLRARGAEGEVLWEERQAFPARLEPGRRTRSFVSLGPHDDVLTLEIVPILGHEWVESRGFGIVLCPEASGCCPAPARRVGR